MNLSDVTPEFTVVYANGWGPLRFPLVKMKMDLVRKGDVLVLNLGSHYSRGFSFKVSLIRYICDCARLKCAPPHTMHDHTALPASELRNGLMF